MLSKERIWYELVRVSKGDEGDSDLFKASGNNKKKKRGLKKNEKKKRDDIRNKLSLEPDLGSKTEEEKG